MSFAVPFLILGLPMFDTLFAIIRRLAHGQNPMAPDRGHIHHRLIDMGLSQKQAVAISYMLSAILGMAAVVLTNDGETQALIFLAAVVVVGAIGFWVIFGHKPKEEKKQDAVSVPQKEEQTEETHEKD